MAKTTDTGRLCKLYASPGENFLNVAIRNELISRQATYCLTPQYIQQQQAAAQAMGMMMFGYGMQSLQNTRPQVMPMNQCVTRNVGGNWVQQCY
jgi:hypothetical protein